IRDDLVTGVQTCALPICQSIIAIVEEYGTNNIYAFHLSTGPQVTEDRAERLRKPLTVADGAAIKTLAPAVEDLSIVAPNVGYRRSEERRGGKGCKSGRVT